MKISDIPFDDDAFKDAVLATGCDQAEQVTEIRARKASIQSVAGLEHFSSLKLLDLTRNQLTQIDLSGNPLLEELYLGNNELEQLDVSANTQLRHLEIFINDIAELDLSMLPNLENLYANKNDLNALDLTANPNIEELQISFNEVEDLSLAAECKPFIVKAQQTRLSDAIITNLKSLLPDSYLKL